MNDITYKDDFVSHKKGEAFYRFNGRCGNCSGKMLEMPIDDGFMGELYWCPECGTFLDWQGMGPIKEEEWSG